MSKHTTLARILAFVALSTSALFVGCKNEEDDEVGEGIQPLVAECVDTGDVVPQGGWICGEDKVVECNTHVGAVVETIYVELPAGSCSSATMTLSDEGPFEVGTHEVTVTTDGVVVANGEAATCTSTLTVVDTVPPVFDPHVVELWPPNHKFHTISIGDCVDVLDVCDPGVQVFFTSAASDEPRNSTGDGNTEVDIANLGCDSVDLLSERKGNGDSRVYTLGVRAIDAAGNIADGECHVIVPHDQGAKIPVDSGIAYQEEAPACGPDLTSSDAP